MTNTTPRDTARAGLVHVIEGHRRLHRDPLQPRRELLRARGHLPLEIGMGKKFHHEKRKPRLVRKSVDPNQTGMGQARRHFQFVLEELPLAGVAGHLWVDHLDRDGRRRGAVDRLPDLAVFAGTELSDERQASELGGESAHAGSGSSSTARRTRP